MEIDEYKTISGPSTGIYREKGSRFISFAYPVTEQEEIKAILESLRKEHHDARHHCYAWMLDPERKSWRMNDDGEPSGTGGKPILGQINSAGLTGILIVVCRYFGGTLLGVSGLTNAYKTAAASAILAAEIVVRTVREYYKLTFPYDSMNDVMKVLKEGNINQSEQSFGLECSIKVNFRVLSKEKILARFARIEGLEFKYLETR